MNRIASIGKTAFTFTTGFGLRAFLKRHKTAAWIIVALIIANEVRGIAVVYVILREWWA